LAPTRELAQQIEEEAVKFGKVKIWIYSKKNNILVDFFSH
jgi:superfamily II DNA/RNA helicase